MWLIEQYPGISDEGLWPWRNGMSRVGNTFGSQGTMPQSFAARPSREADLGL
jgi:hypothetical protein